MIESWTVTTVRTGSPLERQTILASYAAFDSLTFHAIADKDEIRVFPHLEHGVTEIRVKAREAVLARTCDNCGEQMSSIAPRPLVGDKRKDVCPTCMGAMKDLNWNLLQARKTGIHSRRSTAVRSQAPVGALSLSQAQAVRSIAREEIDKHEERHDD